MKAHKALQDYTVFVILIKNRFEMSFIVIPNPQEAVPISVISSLELSYLTYQTLYQNFIINFNFCPRQELLEQI